MKNVTVFLQNKNKPEFGRIDIELPAAEEKLNAALAEIGIPYANPERNCVYSKPGTDSAPFDYIKDEFVNADELNYLAMRLDNFSKYEMAQFQAAAYCENISDVEGLINLTFNIHNYTVVTDFSDLESIGRNYYLSEHTGVTQDEFEKINAAEIGYNLLRRSDGIITPFGAAYKHGKVLEMPYNGETFPQYDYLGETVMIVGLISAYDDMATDKIAWLELPVPDTCIEKALARLSADKNSICLAHVYPENLPAGIMERINTEKETVWSLNKLCRAVDAVNFEDCNKLDAACEFAEVYTAQDITVIAENIEHFDFYPNVGNAEEYGLTLIENAGAFKSDFSLEEFYNYEALGKCRMAREYGRLSDFGYTVFKKAPEVLDELLLRGQNGGISMI